MRFCLVTAEIVDPIFSGNGVASRAVARSLLVRPDDTLVVVCGRPAGDCHGGVAPVHAELAAAVGVGEETSAARLSGWAVPLQSWGTTDRSSAWQEFAAGAGSGPVGAAVDEAAVDVIVFVDWTGSKATRALLQVCRTRPSRVVFFSFCVFSALYGNSAEDLAFYQQEEAAAMDAADVSLCLCPGDKHFLAQSEAAATPHSDGCARRQVHVILPPLRRDLHRLAERSGAGECGAVRGLEACLRAGERSLVVCCLRQVERERVRALSKKQPENAHNGWTSKGVRERVRESERESVKEREDWQTERRREKRKEGVCARSNEHVLVYVRVCVCTYVIHTGPCKKRAALLSGYGLFAACSARA